jgi:catechol 2,3-dioxygenase-like lactoylglutathione lyase family enzyme
MHVEWIDHVVVPVASLSEAAAPYERLGLTLTPQARHKGLGTENRAFFAGGGANDVYVELLAIHDREEAAAAGRTLYLEATAQPRGIVRLMLGVSDVRGAVVDLAKHSIETAVETVSAADGRKICDVAPLDGIDALGITAGLVQDTETREASHVRREAAGRFAHAFTLKRLDHLAMVVSDLEATTRFWNDVLGVPVFGEIRTPGMIIRQMKIGDAIMEFLAADGPESRMAGRPAGMASMCAWEVANLDASVEMARARGFSPSEPSKGVLPGTRVSSIPGSELAGVGMQLLEYV